MKDQSSNPGPAPHIDSGGQERNEHPFYGNQYTNVGSADVPEATEAFRSTTGKDASNGGPQLLDDDYYFT